VERISCIDVSAKTADGFLWNGYEWSLQASSQRKAFSTLLVVCCAMKTHRIHLTAEEQKKLEQVLKRLKLCDFKSYVMSVLQKEWLNIA